MQLLLYECFANSSCKEVNVVPTEVEYEGRAPRMTAPQRQGEPSPGLPLWSKLPHFAPRGRVHDRRPPRPLFLQSFLQGFPPLPVKASCCEDRRNVLGDKNKLV